MFLGAVPWEILIDVASLLSQWQWPVRQRTGLTKNAGHPVQAVSQLSLSQAPHGFAAPYRGFPPFLLPSNCLKTTKLRRLNITKMVKGKEITNFIGFPVFHAKPQQRKWNRCNDLQWYNLCPRLNPGLSYLPSVAKGQHKAWNFTDTSDLYLDKQWVKSLFSFFILFGGGSVEGPLGVVRGPVRR